MFHNRLKALSPTLKTGIFMRRIMLVLCFFAFNNVWAQELPTHSKNIILTEIASDVYFEDEGYERAPQKIEDFSFNQIDESVFLVQGKSYSEWDMKEIEYLCKVEVLSRGMIEVPKDISVSCDLKGENWPHQNK